VAGVCVGRHFIVGSVKEERQGDHVVLKKRVWLRALPPQEETVDMISREPSRGIRMGWAIAAALLVGAVIVAGLVFVMGYSIDITPLRK